MTRVRMKAKEDNIQRAFVLALQKKPEMSVWGCPELLREININLKISKSKISLTRPQLGAFLGRFMKSYKMYRNQQGIPSYIFVKTKR